MVPFIEVSHLPSSSSFYSAVLQPLGLRCISPESKEDNSPLQTSIAYGVAQGGIVLEVRQSENPLKPPRLSSITISAQRRSSVFSFHSCWLKTDPPSWSQFRDKRGLERFYNDRRRAIEGPWVSNESGITVTRAVIYDHDGNRLEVLCHDSPTAPETFKTGRRSPRVLEWKHDFHAESQRSSHIPSPSNELQRFAMAPPNYGASYSGSRHSFHGAPSSSAPTAAQMVASQPGQDSDSPRQSSRIGGLNTTTVVGALLGVAAGAALTYGIVSNSKETSQSHERGPQRGPGLARRATFPEKPVTGHDYPSRPRNEKPAFRDYDAPRKLVDPSFPALPVRGGYVEGDEDVEYGVDPCPPPRYLTQGSHSRHSGRSRASSTSRPVDDTDDSHRRQRSRVSVGRAASVRAQSETPQARVPLVPDDSWDRRSVARTPRSAKPESVVSRPPLSRSHRSSHDPDRDSYVSAKSHRSAVTARQFERELRPSEHEAISRGRRPSQASGATLRAWSRDPSYVSARQVPLPRSAVGSSHANWDPWEVPLPMSGVGSSHAAWDDDMESLAPSDSISCVGSKSSRRSHKRRPR
ncbi:hypothetical protein ACRE_063450 [Hapsidospora chrysogenum ATCC 11550]|uniref:Uncharacterized protein n=1 Tax=Hapsidospora chrysogenum (strain ATCC 11550 / CBS 779.69 / DSM 880 / IAM 14645 / JCM 23072 / IMI 49137) TaxID=857340 RepID=A0A086T0N1_HAPC1|nr:hypothetical protein ACRE_063450 [Hapsidospora chrysogenum ATCC 11550]